MAQRVDNETLVAATVKTVTLAQGWSHVRVTKIDDAAAATVWVRTDGTAPTVEGDDCVGVIGGAGAFTDMKAFPASGETVVKLISAGTPKVSVEGLSI